MVVRIYINSTETSKYLINEAKPEENFKIAEFKIR